MQRMAASAEQDNRVQIPNGTAAVSAECFVVKTGHWSFSGKAEKHAKRLQPLFYAQVRRPTELAFSAPCVFMGGAFVAEKRLRHRISVPQHFIFKEAFIMKNKKLWIAVAALVVVVGVLLAVFFATRPDTQEGIKSFTVTVVHADGTSKDFSYKSDQEYLGAVLLAEGLITGEEGPYGLTVITVDGESAPDWNVAYWSLYEGEDYAMQGIDTTPITDGAVYKLVYTLTNG